MKLLTDFFCVCCFVSQIDENVKREIINHRSLRHPNIVRFKEVSYIFLGNKFEVQTYNVQV